MDELEFGNLQLHNIIIEDEQLGFLNSKDDCVGLLKCYKISLDSHHGPSSNMSGNCNYVDFKFYVGEYDYHTIENQRVFSIPQKYRYRTATIRVMFDDYWKEDEVCNDLSDCLHYIEDEYDFEFYEGDIDRVVNAFKYHSLYFDYNGD